MRITQNHGFIQFRYNTCDQTNQTDLPGTPDEYSHTTIGAEVAMNSEKMQAWCAHKQGLDGLLKNASPADVLIRAGWARSVGGSCPYLTLFSRAGLTRSSADQAVVDLEIYEIPAARNCTYVVPAADFALGLKVGQNFLGGDFKTALKLGATAKELDRLCDKVADALTNATLGPDEIKDYVGSAIRHFGDEGKKRGMTNSLGIALGRLQAHGEIRRVPINGRLDQQRYQYTSWKPNPLDGISLSDDEAFEELARRYFKWIGPATLAEFQWFSGLGVKAAKAAIAPLKLVPFEDECERLLFNEDLNAFHAFRPPAKVRYSLVSSIDSMLLLRRDFRSLLASGAESRSAVANKLLVSLGGVADLPSHAILANGQLAGLWEFDPETESIAWCAFTTPAKAMGKAVKETESFVRDQLGDVRAFSLDSPKSRAPRIAALREIS